MHACGHITVRKARAKRGLPPRARYSVTHDVADRRLGRLRRTILDVIHRIRREVSLKDLIPLVERGDENAIADYLDITQEDFAPIAATAETIYVDAARGMAERISLQKRRISGTFEGRFDLTNPDAVRRVREYRFGLIQGLTEEQRKSLRRVILRAFREGGHPRDQARDIRDFIGLTERQTVAVYNYRNTLQRQDRESSQIRRMVDRYRDRQLRYRATMIARTETIRASSEGQQETWRQATEQGLLDPRETRRIWIVSEDDRLCPTCEDLGDRYADFESGVRLEEEFHVQVFNSKGEVVDEHDTLTPPAHPNCRCTVALVFPDD